jgi:D-alanyl-D-alanine carboxypeptidase
MVVMLCEAQRVGAAYGRFSGWVGQQGIAPAADAGLRSLSDSWSRVVMMQACFGFGSVIAVLSCFACLPASAGPALLFDPANGKVLYAEDQDNLWHPASLTKMMTAYLAFDAVKTGRLKLDQKIPVSEKAFAQVPSKVGLPVGAEMPVDVALRALIIKSANDVAVMLAEAIGGSEEGFVKLMNDTASRMGMTRTKFVNANGLPADAQVTTARDLAQLTRALIRDFPDEMPLWGLTEMQLGKLKLHNHNGLLRSFEGADGIKTGFTCDSGFNVVASATRDGQKLVAVVLGEPSGRDRTVRAATLLDHGFQTYGWKQMFGTKTVDTLPVEAEADAKGVVSVRKQVVSWSCNGRPRAPVAKKGRAPGAVAKAAKGVKPKTAVEVPAPKPVVPRKAQPAATMGPKAAAQSPATAVPPRQIQ